MPTIRRYITLAEASARSGLPVQYLRDWCAAGLFGHVIRTGRIWRLDEQELALVLRAQEVTTREAVPAELSANAAARLRIPGLKRTKGKAPRISNKEGAAILQMFAPSPGTES